MQIQKIKCSAYHLYIFIIKQCYLCQQLKLTHTFTKLVYIVWNQISALLSLLIKLCLYTDNIHHRMCSHEPFIISYWCNFTNCDFNIHICKYSKPQSSLYDLNNIIICILIIYVWILWITSACFIDVFLCNQHHSITSGALANKYPLH